MYKFRKDNVSVLVIVDRRRRKNNGCYPVKIEVVCRRVQKYYPTGKDVTLDEWEKMWKCRKMSAKCSSIENSFHLVRSAVEDIASRGRFSFMNLERRLGYSMMTVNEMLVDKMNSMMEQGRINSFYRYRSTLRALEAFGGKKIELDMVTPQWLERCEAAWMKSGKSTTTVAIYMKIARIRQWRGDQQTEYWRDMWLFSYLCNGINFRDMIFLRYRDIVDGELNFVRSKTERKLDNAKVIKVPLLPEMKDIMKRCGKGMSGEPDDFIFHHAKKHAGPLEVSMLTRKVIAQCNSALKIISKEAGIPAFSTYSARHSFATIMKRGGADLTFISESLGHTNTSMTENYIRGYEKEDRLRFASLLL